MVFAKFSCAEPNFKADGVVLLAVPAKGLTYLTRDGSCANALIHIVDNNDIKREIRAFNILASSDYDRY